MDSSNNAKTLLTAVFAVTALILVVWECAQIVQIRVSNYDWHVSRNYKDRDDAAKLFARLNTDVLKLLKLLSAKYNVNNETAINENRLTIPQHMVLAMLHNYNPEALVENDPKYAGSSTSYTLDKGRRMFMCLRDKTAPNNLVPYPVALFVTLHELAHIANWDGWEHQDPYWARFKWLLRQASEFDILVPINYAITPVEFCGLHVNYNPYFDADLPDI